MLENGLFFVLGFLASALFALMIAPAIWRRAVALTQRKIESAVPLTLNEIQAEKDQLRAEFAMSNRKLEVSLEEAKERSAIQVIEINKRREQMQVMEDEALEKDKQIETLQADASQLRKDIQALEDTLKQPETTLRSTEMNLEERSLSYDAVKLKYQSVVDDLDGQKIEMVARETQVDSVLDEARETREQLKKQKATSANLSTELKAAKVRLTKEQKRTQDLNAKLDTMQASFADTESRLERRDNDIKRLRAKTGEDTSHADILQQDLDMALTEKEELAKQVLDVTKRMEALSKGGNEKSSGKKFDGFSKEREELVQALEKAEAERDALRIELSAAEISSGDSIDKQKQENAKVRDKINELAAQLTAMTAASEGADSPINAILNKKAAKGSKAAKSGEKSLADRIRAIQAVSEDA